MEFMIIDSMTHFWAGEGGLLEQQAAVAKRTNNSYTAWQQITPLFNKMMSAILQSDIHTIMTFRTKKAFAIEDENGKKKVVAKGMESIFREGQDYEATIYFELDQSHIAATSKDRTGLFDQQYFMISPETGAMIYNWMAHASDTSPSVIVPNPTVSEVSLDEKLKQDVDRVIKQRCEGASPEEKKAIGMAVKEVAGTANYMAVTDVEILKKLYEQFKE